MSRTAEVAAPGAVLVVGVDVGPDAQAWVTGRARDAVPPPVGAAGNLAHRRPHVPSRLAADRREVFGRMGLAIADTVWMRQVHGPGVAVVDEAVPPGAEVRDVDALVTRQPGRALVVQVADCVPVLLAGGGVVGAVHAGRRGVESGVVPVALERMVELGADLATTHAHIGPAIGGCCYEVPSEMREDLADLHPVAAGTTTWGTPSLDLPAAVEQVLADHGVGTIERTATCTRCDPEARWFSHRGDPDAGRQVGVVVAVPA